MPASGPIVRTYSSQSVTPRAGVGSVAVVATIIGLIRLNACLSQVRGRAEAFGKFSGKADMAILRRKCLLLTQSRHCKLTRSNRRRPLSANSGHPQLREPISQSAVVRRAFGPRLQSDCHAGDQIPNP